MKMKLFNHRAMIQALLILRDFGLKAASTDKYGVVPCYFHATFSDPKIDVVGCDILFSINIRRWAEWSNDRDCFVISDLGRKHLEAEGYTS